MDDVQNLLNHLTDTDQLASISVAVRVDGREFFHHTTGMARLDPPMPARPDQAYDLASVTKVLSGTAIAAALVESGALALEDPVRRWLPDIPPDQDQPIQVQHLLQHSSGLPAWEPLYERATAAWGTVEARRQVLDRTRAISPDHPPGTTHIYSDIGFLWLLQVLEAAGRAPLHDLFERHVRAPSGIRDLRYGWPEAAATEWPCPVRGTGIQGTVHDLNCASIGGVSTHAGLFGTARAVAGLGDAFLGAVAGDPAHRGLPGATLRRFWTMNGAGSHRVGWDGVSTDGYTSTGSHFPSDAIGHLGYTGTSIWLVPSRRTSIAVLSNRVHPVDDKAPIRRIRPRIHDAISTALGWSA